MVRWKVESCGVHARFPADSTTLDRWLNNINRWLGGDMASTTSHASSESLNAAVKKFTSQRSSPPYKVRITSNIRSLELSYLSVYVDIIAIGNTWSLELSYLSACEYYNCTIDHRTLRSCSCINACWVMWIYLSKAYFKFCEILLICAFRIRNRQPIELCLLIN